MDLTHTHIGTEKSNDGGSVVTHAANAGDGIIVRSIITTATGQVAACSSYVPGLVAMPGAEGKPGYLKTAVR